MLDKSIETREGVQLELEWNDRSLCDLNYIDKSLALKLVQEL